MEGRAGRGCVFSLSFGEPPGLGTEWDGKQSSDSPIHGPLMAFKLFHGVQFTGCEGQQHAADHSPISVSVINPASCFIKLIKVELDQMWLLSRDSPRPCKTSLGLNFIARSQSFTGQTSFACPEKTIIRTKALDKEIQSTVLEPACCCTPVIEACGGAGGSAAQGHLRQFKASLVYRRLDLKKPKEGN